jgi:hypothetical protein
VEKETFTFQGQGMVCSSLCPLVVDTVSDPFRYSTISMVAPFRPPQTMESIGGYRPVVHMGPTEAVKAHMDLGTPLSIAAHFQVFRLGVEGFDNAVDVLIASLKEHNLKPDAFMYRWYRQVKRILLALSWVSQEPAVLRCQLEIKFEAKGAQASERSITICH